MPPTVYYHDVLPARRAALTAALGQAGVKIRRCADWPELEPDVQLVLAGFDEVGSAELALLANLAEQHPTVPVVVLAEAADAGRLLAAVRAGARDAVGEPEAVLEALQRLWERRARTSTDTRRPGRVVAVFALKGGVGKSLVSTNLAMALQRAGDAPVTAVDLSLPCGNLDMYLDLQGPRGVADLLPLGGDLDRRVLEQALLSHESGVNLLAGARAGELGACSSRPLLDTLTQRRAIALVDVGAFLDEAQVTALEAADLIVVPVSPLISSAVTMPAIWEHLGSLGIPADRILPVLNQTCPDGEPLPDAVLTRLLRGKPRHQLPWAGADAARSLNEGRPLAWYQPRHPLARAFDALASDVLTRIDLPEPAPVQPVVRLRNLARRKTEAFWALFGTRQEAGHVPA